MYPYDDDDWGFGRGRYHSLLTKGKKNNKKKIVHRRFRQSHRNSSLMKRQTQAARHLRHEKNHPPDVRFRLRRADVSFRKLPPLKRIMWSPFFVMR